MALDRIAEYDRRAEEAEEQARRLPDADQRRAFEKVAAGWRVLSEQARSDLKRGA